MTNDNQNLQKYFCLLAKGDFQERWEVAKIIAEFEAIAINPLADIILNENQELELRWFALNILGKINTPKDDQAIILILVKLLEITKEDELINSAVEIFIKQGKKAIVILSCLILVDEYKLIATKALITIPSASIIEPLLSVVNDQNWEIRLKALEGLSNFKDERITQILIQALQDTNSNIRKEAIANLPSRIKDNSTEIVSLLTPLLSDINLEVCQQTAIAISRIKTPLITNILFDTLIKNTTPQPLQIKIIQCLGWMETVESLNSLSQALNILSEEALIIEIINILGRMDKQKWGNLANEILLEFYNSHGEIKENSLIFKTLAYAWQLLK